MTDDRDIVWSRFPVVPFAFAVVAGVCFGLYVQVAIGTLLIALLSCLILFTVCVAGFRNTHVAAILAVLFFLILGMVRTTEMLARDQRSAIADMAEQTDGVSAIGQIQQIVTDSRRSVLILKNAVLEKDSLNVSCRPLLIRIYADTVDVAMMRVGDIVHLRGRLDAAIGFDITSVAALKMSLIQREGGSIQCEERSVICFPEHVAPFKRAIANTQQHIRDVFDRHLSADGAALCEALVLGTRSDFGWRFADQLRITGLSHIFALSGMNVGFLAGILWILLTIACVPQKARYILISVAVVGYMELGSEAPSLVRASLMAIAWVASRLLYRRFEIVNVLFTAAFIELLWRPLDILDAGFILSYFAVLGIVGGYPFLSATLCRMVRSRPSPLLNATIDIVALTLVAQIATLPYVAYEFHRIPLLGIIGNIIAIPGFSLLLLWAGLLLLVAGIAPVAAGFVGASIDVLSNVLSAVVDCFAALPLASVQIASLPFILLIILCLAAGLVVFGFARGHGRWAIAGLFLGANVFAWNGILGRDSEELRLAFVSVENGDAILISSDNHHILVDTGPSVMEWSAGKRIAQYLRERDIQCLDAIILTHPDNDHIGGTRELLRRIQVRQLFANPDSSGSRTYLETQLALSWHKVPVSSLVAGDRIQLTEHSYLTILSPDTTLLGEYRTENQRSLVMRLDAYGNSALFVADIDSTIEKRLLAWGIMLRANLLKIAHHGSKSGTSDLLLDAVSPQIGVISAGKNNRYGHPNPAVIARLQTRSVAIYSTIQSGTLDFVSRNGVWIYIPSKAQRLAQQWRLIGA